MIEFYKKYARTGLDVFLLGLSIVIILFVISWMYQLVAPLFYAIVWFVIIEPLAHRMNRRGVQKGIATLLSIWIWLLLLVGVFSFLGYVFVAQTEQLVRSLPAITVDFANKLQALQVQFQDQLDTMDPEWAMEWQGYTATVLNKISGWSNQFILPFFKSLQSIPLVVFHALIGLIMAYFLSLERDAWVKVLRDRLPESVKTAGRFLHRHVWSGLQRYMRAQFILVGMAFVIVWTGFLILGVDKAFSLALLCAILDLLPIVGIATMILPWSIYAWLTGDSVLAIGLLVIYGILVVFRQIAEPKLSGESLGVSAFTMIVFLFLSFGIFGIAGMIATPVFILLLKAIFEQGVWRKWIYWPEEEAPVDATDATK